MTPQQVELVQQSSASWPPRRAGLGWVLYRAVRHRAFAQADVPGRHARAAQEAFGRARAGDPRLDAPAGILDPLKTLAVRHVGYGVKPEHYTYMGDVELLRTLEKGLGEEFTPELRNAWVAAFQALATIMKEAAYGTVSTKMHPLPVPTVVSSRSEKWIIPL